MPQRKEYDTTVYIFEPSKIFKNKPKELAPDKAKRMINMLENEYTLTTEDICHLLHCNRKYVDDYIKLYVKNIFIDAKQMNWIAEILDLGNGFVDSHRSYYYFSQNSFMEYFLDSIILTRQTIYIDLTDHLLPDIKQLIYGNVLEDESISNQDKEYLLNHIHSVKAEIKKHDDKYLTALGKKLLASALPVGYSTKRKLTPEIYDEELKNNIKFEDLPLLKAPRGGGNEKFYRNAFLHGYIKVKINGKSFFIDQSKYSDWGITLSYEEYSKICCYK